MVDPMGKLALLLGIIEGTRAYTGPSYVMLDVSPSLQYPVYWLFFSLSSRAPANAR